MDPFSQRFLPFFVTVQISMFHTKKAITRLLGFTPSLFNHNANCIFLLCEYNCSYFNSSRFTRRNWGSEKYIYKKAWICIHQAWNIVFILLHFDCCILYKRKNPWMHNASYKKIITHIDKHGLYCFWKQLRWSKNLKSLCLCT